MAASRVAVPETMIPRLPTVPASHGLASVSTFTTMTSLTGTPSSSATMSGIPNPGIVPISILPMWTVADPSSLTLTMAPPPGPALSIHEPVAIPMPWFFFSFTLPQPIFSFAMRIVSPSETSRSLGTPTILSPASGIFLRRNSAGSMPSFAAIESMCDSTAKPAGAPHRAADLLIGVSHVAVDVDIGRQVPAAEHVRAAGAGHGAKTGVGAGVIDHFARAGDDSAVFLHAGFNVQFRAGADGGRDGFLRLVEDDHHRPFGCERQQSADRLNGRAGGDAARLAAEAAADIRA